MGETTAQKMARLKQGKDIAQIKATLESEEADIEARTETKDEKTAKKARYNAKKAIEELEQRFMAAEKEILPPLTATEIMKEISFNIYTDPDNAHFVSYIQTIDPTTQQTGQNHNYKRRICKNFLAVLEEAGLEVRKKNH